MQINTTGLNPVSTHVSPCLQMKCVKAKKMQYFSTDTTETLHWDKRFLHKEINNLQEFNHLQLVVDGV